MYGFPSRLLVPHIQITVIFCHLSGDAWHYRHDARRNQAEQGQDHPPASEWSLALLEGKHPMEGRSANQGHVTIVIWTLQENTFVMIVSLMRLIVTFKKY